MAVLFVTTIALLLPLGSAICPNGWMNYTGSDSCYLFSEKLSTHHDARLACAAFDSSLAQIESAGEMSHIQKILLQKHSTAGDRQTSQYWIDGNDIAIDGDWIWEHNRPVTFFDWAPDQPDNYHDGNRVRQDCLCLYGPKQFKMDDGWCFHRLSYICEISNRAVVDPGIQLIG